MSFVDRTTASSTKIVGTQILRVRILMTKAILISAILLHSLNAGRPRLHFVGQHTHYTLSSSNSEYLTYDNSEFFFTCWPGKEKRRLIMGALLQNLENKAPVRNSLIVLHHYILRNRTYHVCNIHSCTMFAQMESIFLTG